MKFIIILYFLLNQLIVGNFEFLLISIKISLTLLLKAVGVTQIIWWRKAKRTLEVILYRKLRFEIWPRRQQLPVVKSSLNVTNQNFYISVPLFRFRRGNWFPKRKRMRCGSRLLLYHTITNKTVETALNRSPSTTETSKFFSKPFVCIKF